MDLHVFHNLSRPIKLANIPNLVRLVPLTMEVIVLKSLMVPWVNIALMDNLMAPIDSNTVKTTITATSFMVWVTMIIQLVGVTVTISEKLV